MSVGWRVLWSTRLSAKALNNEFFTKACIDWRKRLANGTYVIQASGGKTVVKYIYTGVV